MSHNQRTCILSSNSSLEDIQYLLYLEAVRRSGADKANIQRQVDEKMRQYKKAESQYLHWYAKYVNLVKLCMTRNALEQENHLNNSQIQLAKRNIEIITEKIATGNMMMDYITPENLGLLKQELATSKNCENLKHLQLEAAQNKAAVQAITTSADTVETTVENAILRGFEYFLSEKFRFCGEGDCPDWVLAEIISTLSNLSAAKLEKLASIVSRKIIGLPFDEDEIKSIAAEVADDGKSAVACVDFILVNSTRYNVGEDVLSEELQQLGLPKLHASAMCQVLTRVQSSIREKLIETCFKINELESVEHKDSTGLYDAVLLELKMSNQLAGDLPEDKIHTVSIDRANLSALLRDMKEARNIVEKFKANKAA